MTLATSTDRPVRSSTAARKREILSAALTCFAAKGYDATTLADIRERAGASTGSIYHHFANKAELAAELYLEGVRATQVYSLRALLKRRSLEDGIESLVFSSLEWVQENAEFARFLFAMRHADFMEPVEAELERMNREALATALSWLREHVGTVELKGATQEAIRAITFGPTMHYARNLLRSDPTRDIARDKRALATAVTAALRPLLSVQLARKRAEGRARTTPRKGSAR